MAKKSETLCSFNFIVAVMLQEVTLMWQCLTPAVMHFYPRMIVSIQEKACEELYVSPKIEDS
jgi:hypothetical protein